MKKPESQAIDRRTMLKNTTLMLPAGIVFQAVRADDTPEKKAPESNKTDAAKPDAQNEKARVVSVEEMEIERRMTSIMDQFGEHLKDEANFQTVRNDVAANYFRARRLRTEELSDFDGPSSAFLPVRGTETWRNAPDSAPKPARIQEQQQQRQHQADADQEPAFATIYELAIRLRLGKTTAEELALYFLDRLERIGPKLNCVATLTRDLALKQARAADERFKAGNPLSLLDGIPYGAKDLLAVAGYPTSNGCAPYVKRVVDRDATVIKNLTGAGAVLVAKLAMVECAGGLGYRQANASAFGPGLTPYDLKRWSGGSSSGSGSAVAAGLVPFAIGSETWGSITTPASYCGLSGLRPTYGRVSRSGAYALSYSLDKIGPLARTAAETDLVLKTIAGVDSNDISTVDYPWYGINRPANDRYTVAVLRDGVEKAQPEVRANFDRAVEVFRQFADIVEIDLPDGPYSDVLLTILGAESASAFEELVESGLVQQVTAPEDRIGGYADRTIPAMDYIRAQRLRGPLCREFDKYMSRYDAVLTIPTSATAPLISENFGSKFSHKSLGGPGNLCGSPALVMPSGLDENSLPTAIQLDSRVGNEAVLVHLGRYFQSRTHWHEQKPDLSRIM